MKTPLYIIMPLLVVCLVGSQNAIAQDDGPPPGQLFSIHEDVVIPSTLEKYEAAAKNLAESFAAHDVSSVTYMAAVTDDFTYSYFTPIENLAAVEKMGAGFGELSGKMGADAFGEMMAGFNGCYDSHKNYLVRLRTDLSYNPEFGRDISDGMLFRHWDFYYLHPGMESESEEIAKEWIELNKSINSPGGYRLYTGAMGTDGPLFVVVQSATDALDYNKRRAEWMELAGDKGKALWAKTWKVVREYDSKDGRIRPDISVMAKEEAEQ